MGEAGTDRLRDDRRSLGHLKRKRSHVRTAFCGGENSRQVTRDGSREDWGGIAGQRRAQDDWEGTGEQWMAGTDTAQHYCDGTSFGGDVVHLSAVDATVMALHSEATCTSRHLCDGTSFTEMTQTVDMLTGAHAHSTCMHGSRCKSRCTVLPVRRASCKHACVHAFGVWDASVSCTMATKW